MIDTTFLAYTAGLFDGEGCVVIERNKVKDHLSGYRYQLKTTITIRESWLLEELKACFGGSLKHEYKRNEKHAPVGRWRLTDKGAGYFLTAIIPYLRLKREQADIALKFRQSKEAFKHGYRVKIPPEQQAIQDWCYWRVRELNTHGVSRLEPR